MSKLIGEQKFRKKVKKFICNACLTICWNKKSFDNHQRSYAEYKPALAVMPDEEKWHNVVEYKYYDQKKEQFVPCTIYTDLECILKPVETNGADYCAPSGLFANRDQQYKCDRCMLHCQGYIEMQKHVNDYHHFHFCP